MRWKRIFGNFFGSKRTEIPEELDVKAVMLYAIDYDHHSGGVILKIQT